MTEKEWKSAAASTLNAHYTSKEVITGVWDLIERLGFEGGSVLEPSAGVRIISVNQISDSDYQFALESGRMSEKGLILGKSEGRTITLKIYPTRLPSGQQRVLNH